MEVNIINQSGLDAELSVKVLEADYKEDFEKSLKNYGKTMKVPGFRPGHIPTGLIRKMIGKDAKRELVEKFLQKNIDEYLNTQNIKLVLSPLSRYISEDIDWNANDLEFTYDIGLRPEIKLDLKPLNKLTKYTVDLSDADVAKDRDSYLRRSAKMDRVDAYVYPDEDYFISLQFTELDEAGEAVEGGLQKTKFFNAKNMPIKLGEYMNAKEPDTETVVKITDILTTDEMAENFELDPLSIKDLFSDFRIKVLSVMKVAMPVLDEAFFAKEYPDGSISSEEELNAHWKTLMLGYYNNEANNMLATDVKKNILADTKMELPEQYVRKYFDATMTEAEKIAIEESDKQYQSFLEELKWLILSEYISEQNGIEITEDDVIHYTEDMIANELGRSGVYDQDHETLHKYALDYLTKENNFNRTSLALRDGKVFDWLLNQVTPVVQTVDVTKFEELKTNKTK